MKNKNSTETDLNPQEIKNPSNWIPNRFASSQIKSTQRIKYCRSGWKTHADEKLQRQLQQVSHLFIEFTIDSAMVLYWVIDSDNSEMCITSTCKQSTRTLISCENSNMSPSFTCVAQLECQNCNAPKPLSLGALPPPLNHPLVEFY